MVHLHELHPGFFVGGHRSCINASWLAYKGRMRHLKAFLMGNSCTFPFAFQIQSNCSFTTGIFIISEEVIEIAADGSAYGRRGRSVDSCFQALLYFEISNCYTPAGDLKLVAHNGFGFSFVWVIANFSLGKDILLNRIPNACNMYGSPHDEKRVVGCCSLIVGMPAHSFFICSKMKS